MERSQDYHLDMKFVTGINRMCLNLVGGWPDTQNTKRDIHSKYWFLVPIVFLLFFINIPQTTLTIMSWGDLDLVIQLISNANIVAAASVIKLIVLRVNRKALGSLLKFMADDWKNSNDDKKLVMMKKAKLARMISISCFILSYVLIMTYLIMKVFTYIKGKLNGIKNSGFQLYLAGYCPPSVEESPVFELFFMGQFVGSIFSINCNTGCDSFLVTLVMHVCAQFSILRSSLKNLATDADPENSMEFVRRLGIIIRRHNHLNRFANTIENTFNIILLMQMILVSFQLCFQGFHFIMKISDENEEIITSESLYMILFVAFVLIHLYLYCYVGEMLLYESEQVRLAAYECCWYIRAPKESKTMILIMASTLRPAQLTAGKFCVFALSTFTDVLKTAMSYMSVILAAKDR